MESLPEKLEMLICSMDFSELNSDDASYVLGHISADQYGEYRKLISEGRRLFDVEDKLPGTDDIKTGLMNKVNRKNSQRQPMALFARLLNYRLPVYQPAAAAVILFICALFLWDYYPQDTKIIYRTRETVDTVLLEKKVPVYETREVEKIVYKFVNRKNHLPASYTTSDDNNLAVNSAVLSEGHRKATPDIAEIMNIGSNGRSLRDDSSMKKYLYTVY